MVTSSPVLTAASFVSMKSGLEDRNNTSSTTTSGLCWRSLNEVRPGRPEQYAHSVPDRPQRVVSMKSGLEDRNNPVQVLGAQFNNLAVSMKSGLEDRNNSPKNVPNERALESQ